MIGAAVTDDAIRRAFERAPLLCDRLVAGGPYASRDDALARARAILAELSEAERIAVLDAHPRIGADPRTLSEASRAEQGMERAADRPIQHHLEVLSEEYERRFGFRFVVFVAGRSRREILLVLRDRLHSRRDAELRTGLEEFLAIASDRLESA